MGLFDRQQQPPRLDFTTRADAFSYMLKYLMDEKKMEPMEAAKQANEFAEIFATNMGIPIKTEPEPQGVDKYISIAEKIGNYVDAHPKVVEVGLGLATFVAGLFTGKEEEKVTESQQTTAQPKEKRDFDKLT
jgi:hypothetical protein